MKVERNMSIIHFLWLTDHWLVRRLMCPRNVYIQTGWRDQDLKMYSLTMFSLSTDSDVDSGIAQPLPRTRSDKSRRDLHNGYVYQYLIFLIRRHQKHLQRSQFSVSLSAGTNDPQFYGRFETYTYEVLVYFVMFL